MVREIHMALICFLSDIVFPVKIVSFSCCIYICVIIKIWAFFYPDGTRTWLPYPDCQPRYISGQDVSFEILGKLFWINQNLITIIISVVVGWCLMLMVNVWVLTANHCLNVQRVSPVGFYLHCHHTLRVHSQKKRNAETRGRLDPHLIEWTQASPKLPSPLSKKP